MAPTKRRPSDSQSSTEDDGTKPMNRRTYLRTVAAGTAASVAGCLGSSSDSDPEQPTYLADPDPQIASTDKAYPAWGQRLPDVSLPAPLRDEIISPAGFDDRDVFMTFFYSHCQTVCPRLVSTLRNVQTRATDDGSGDEVVFLAVTFDPERDTESRLREWASVMHVDLDAGNWYFLRPDSHERAKEVVQETYGVGFSKTTPEHMDMYMFNHLGLILLANRRTYVERAYLTTDPTWQDLYADFETLRAREG